MTTQALICALVFIGAATAAETKQETPDVWQSDYYGPNSFTVPKKLELERIAEQANADADMILKGIYGGNTHHNDVSADSGASKRPAKGIETKLDPSGRLQIAISFDDGKSSSNTAHVSKCISKNNPPGCMEIDADIKITQKKYSTPVTSSNLSEGYHPAKSTPGISPKASLANSRCGGPKGCSEATPTSPPPDRIPPTTSEVAPTSCGSRSTSTPCSNPKPTTNSTTQDTEGKKEAEKKAAGEKEKEDKRTAENKDMKDRMARLEKDLKTDNELIRRQAGLLVRLEKEINAMKLDENDVEMIALQKFNETHHDVVFLKRKVISLITVLQRAQEKEKEVQDHIRELMLHKDRISKQQADTKQQLEKLLDAAAAIDKQEAKITQTISQVTQETTMNVHVKVAPSNASVSTDAPPATGGKPPEAEVPTPTNSEITTNPSDVPKLDQTAEEAIKESNKTLLNAMMGDYPHDGSADIAVCNNHHCQGKSAMEMLKEENQNMAARIKDFSRLINKLGDTLPLPTAISSEQVAENNDNTQQEQSQEEKQLEQAAIDIAKSSEELRERSLKDQNDATKALEQAAKVQDDKHAQVTKEAEEALKAAVALDQEKNKAEQAAKYLENDHKSELRPEPQAIIASEPNPETKKRIPAAPSAPSFRAQTQRANLTRSHSMKKRVSPVYDSPYNGFHYANELSVLGGHSPSVRAAGKSIPHLESASEATKMPEKHPQGPAEWLHATVIDNGNSGVVDFA
ncbi:hypothetical protein AAMO2058_000711000 [Amorphochlora amoebiformis]